MKTKCTHKWGLKDKTIFDSPFRQISSHVSKLSGDTPNGFYDDRVVFVFICELCGDYSIEER